MGGDSLAHPSCCDFPQHKACRCHLVPARISADEPGLAASKHHLSSSQLLKLCWWYCGLPPRFFRGMDRRSSYRPHKHSFCTSSINKLGFLYFSRCCLPCSQVQRAFCSCNHHHKGCRLFLARQEFIVSELVYVSDLKLLYFWDTQRSELCLCQLKLISFFAYCSLV